MASIKIAGLTKKFGTKAVVDEVDLDIVDGEFIVLLGPSGCGKTTVLRMIAGLEQISGGQLFFDDKFMNDEPPDRRNVGMVFQNYALYPHMTVEKNLSFGLGSRRRVGSRSSAKQEIRSKVCEVAKLLDIENLLDHRPKQLSGGQRQRVALGRALIRKPSVFLMDEPLSNLDANLREKVRMELARLHDQLAITTIFVTHDQVEALTLADRVVVMNLGKVLQIGTPSEIYGSPADSFVAHFIGTPGMNLWTLPWRNPNCLSTADDARDHSLGVQLGSSVTLAVDFSEVLDEAGRSITLGIRPEHLRPLEEVSNPAALVDFRIETFEQLGSHQLAYGCLGSGDQEAGVVQLDAKFRCRPGEHVALAASLDDVHLFAADSGKRLPGPNRARLDMRVNA
ncbi:MAG: ATP-binding cassette domain-containing protein [Acidimicrobiaceae bacterium]|nr:ATP-binding cassette domain-containing protein [Acidimicrobiaceae bacterium]